MLSARFSTASRRAGQRHRALTALRLNHPAVVPSRWQSTDDGGRPQQAETAEQETIDAFEDVLRSAKQLEKATLRKLKKKGPPSGVFEAVGSGQRSNPFNDYTLEAKQEVPLGEAETEVPLDGAVRQLGRKTRKKKVPRQHHTEPRDGEHEFDPLPLPTDLSQLKALPTGFHDMTYVERQEELWIVHAEGRLGHEWELADPGKHKPYDNSYPPYSPSKVLGMLHRWRSRGWTSTQYRLARAIAGNRSLRLPVLAAQAFLRRHTFLMRRHDIQPKLEAFLGSTEEWKARVAALELHTGVTEADIKQWLWILSPESGDVKFQRFFKSRCRKPFFLMQILLAKDKRIHEPATFLQLLQYVRENYVLADRPQDELNHPGYEGQGRAMTWWHFLTFLYRLVWHCRERWPVAMPLLARLAADYIGTMPLESNARAMTGYQARSLVLNKSLRYLGWPASIRPFDHMEHNWAAQRHLLRLAATAEPPLVMDQNAYRTVRTVLIALSKTKGEAKNADRAAKTWPPYRRTLDGIDERRDPEDDLSRSAKAGMLMRAAGYGDDIVDRALSALGGSTFGQAPTIQTRALVPTFYSGRLTSENLFSEWAAQVRATRNAREAWMAFDNPPEPDIRPNVQVYAEMFEKLFARPVTDSPAIRPGDVKEVFPVYDGNLSEFEIARLTPPTPMELYDLMMLRDRIRPHGQCLVVLVRNAGSKTAALRYLKDSIHAPHIQAFRDPPFRATPKSLSELNRIPPPLFNAWIDLLCRIHTRRPRYDSMIALQHDFPDAQEGADRAVPDGAILEETRARGISRGGSILEAIHLATEFQAQNGRASARDRAPWLTIMKALAGPKILYSRRGTEYNVIVTTMAFLRIFERTTMAKGRDPASFEALCLMIRKALKLHFFMAVEGGKMVPRPTPSHTGAVEDLVARAHRHAVKTFAALTTPVSVNPTSTDSADDNNNAETEQGAYDDVDDGIAPTMLHFNVVGRPLYRYMLALACCGDHAEMVRVMDWLLDGWDQPYVREEAKAPHNLEYHYTVRTIAYFAQMGRELVDPDEMDRIRQRLDDMRAEKGCTWFWPPESDVPRRRDRAEGALPELETDLVLVEKCERLRQLINFANPDAEASAPDLDSISAALRLEIPGQGSVLRDLDLDPERRVSEERQMEIEEELRQGPV